MSEEASTIADPSRLPSIERAGDANEILEGGGEMGGLVRSYDWSATPLGAVHGWPQSLRTTVSMLLKSRFPMFLWWGPELVQFYNDGYRPSLGNDRHPQALGARGREFWADIWDVIGPLIEQVKSGRATWAEDQLIPIIRDGFFQEVYWTFSYSPIVDESGSVAGILVVCSETTRRVQSDRQMRTLRDLAARSSQAQDEAAAWRGIAEVLATNTADVPFALVYALDEAGACATLKSRSVELGARLSPEEVSLSEPAAHGWPLGLVLASGDAQLVTDLQVRFGDHVGPDWPEPIRSALVLPLTRPGLARPYGALVAALSPRRVLDAGYRDFFELVADQAATAIGNARAYTEEKKRAEALAAIDRAKTAFFSNVSHEFRTPLTLMLGPTDDLLAGAHGVLTAPQRAQLELVRRNLLRLQRLVNALLDFSKAEAGRAQARYEPVDLAALTRELAGSFRSAIERAGIELIVDCPSLDEAIFVDRDMWEQIVLNLLSNAFKFTFEGRITVTLRAQDDRAVLQVADTGVGVRAEEIPRLFERFHRVDGTRARTHEGSGIGLALVRELLRLHGGTIGVDSEYGSGTVFSVAIPKGSAHLPKGYNAAAVERTASPVRASAFVEEALRWLDGEAEQDARADDPNLAAPLPSDVEPAQDARILVADDNADMREYLRRILAAKWRVDTVPNGRAALEAARARRPDLILTDVMMPVLDGLEMLRELRGDPELQAIPVIVLSARAGADSRVEGLEAGADDYLVKPFSARELIARVSTQLKLARAQQSALAHAARSESELRKLLALRDDFLAVASHEFRTPLTTLGLEAESLLRSLREESDGAARVQSWMHKAERMLKQAGRMERLIELMLDVAGYGALHEPVTEDLDLAVVAGSVVERMRAESRQAAAMITVRSEPVAGRWERRRLEQILNQLLGNALKFGADKPVDVTIAALGDLARVTVADRGIGIAPADHDRIFGRFERAASAQQYSGFGLGLWIVRELVKAMGGEVHVQSRLGEGATFVVELPRYP